MTTPTEDFKNVWMEIKGLDSELQVYRLVFEALKQALARKDPDFPQLADDALAEARRSPILAEKMRQKYDVVLEKYFQPGVEVLSPGEVLKLLQLRCNQLKFSSHLNPPVVKR